MKKSGFKNIIKKNKRYISTKDQASYCVRKTFSSLSNSAPLWADVNQGTNQSAEFVYNDYNDEYIFLT